MVALLCAAAAGAAADQVVVNQEGRYRVTIPAGWIVWDLRPGGGIAATTYPPDRAPHGGLVPPGEARIAIYPQPGDPRPLDRWISESLNYTDLVSRRKVALATGRHGDVASYIEVEVSYDIALDVYCRRVTAFYSLKGRLFAAEVEFREDDPRGPRYRAALETVVRSVRSSLRN